MDVGAILRSCGELTVYIMGVSFLLGSLCTIFILVVFDMLKLVRKKDPNTLDQD